MDDIRREIDRLDRRLVLLLAERQTYIERAGHIKPNRTAVRDDARIEDVVAKVLESANTIGLSASVAEPVWRAMMEAFIKHEFGIFDTQNESLKESA